MAAAIDSGSHELDSDSPVASSVPGWLPPLLIVVVGGAAYSGSLHGPFVLDDTAAILANPTIRRLWPIGPVLASRHDTTVIGRPLLNASLALNYAVGGTRVEGYHLFNLAIHLSVALVLFGIVRRTLLLPALPPRFRDSARGLALVCALIWVVHPLASAAVLYTVQRCESMAALFYLLTLYYVLRGATDARRPPLWYGAAILACLAGMATKETTATAPLATFLYDRAFLAGSFREAWRRRKGLYLGLAATWVPLGLLVAYSEGRSGTVALGSPVGSRDYALTQCSAICTYLRLSFWPDRLVFDYGDSLAAGVAEIVPYAVVIGLLLAATIWLVARHPQWAFPACWVWLVLAPTSTIIPITTQTIAEHRMYLPLSGLVVLIVMTAFAACGRLASLPGSPAARRTASTVFLLLVAGVIGGLAWRTWLRCQDYRTALTLWQDTIRKNPENARAHNNLGAALVEAGRREEAIDAFSRAIAIRPQSVTYFNRAIHRAALGKFEPAIEDLSMAIKLQPDSGVCYSYRGTFHRLRGDWEAALRDLDRAIDLEPGYPVSYESRAIAHHHLGNREAARCDIRRFLNLGGRGDPQLVQTILGGATEPDALDRRNLADP